MSMCSDALPPVSSFLPPEPSPVSLQPPRASLDLGMSLPDCSWMQMSQDALCQIGPKDSHTCAPGVVRLFPPPRRGRGPRQFVEACSPLALMVFWRLRTPVPKPGFETSFQVLVSRSHSNPSEKQQSKVQQPRHSIAPLLGLIIHPSEPLG